MGQKEETTLLVQWRCVRGMSIDIVTNKGGVGKSHVCADDAVRSIL